ncbi:MAG: alpha/beta fold hydrolase, partial [Actinobacteria bacterium]|nr:alpha/beta fold hydrolase [Actinomycetota bacterium]
DVNPPNAHSDVHLMHGFTGSKEDFWELSAQLSQLGYRVVAHDHRGQSQSSHSDGDAYTLEVLANDAIEVTRQLGLRKPHALGHSFGGLVARRAIIVEPVIWSSITLLCTGPAVPQPMVANLMRTIDILTDRTMPAAWQYFLDHADQDVPIRADENPSSMYAQRWNRSDVYSVLAQAQILLTAVDETMELRVAAVPAHVVYGENDDAWPLVEQDDVAARLGAPVTKIPGAGHCPNEDLPMITAQVLSKWWATNS